MEILISDKALKGDLMMSGFKDCSRHSHDGRQNNIPQASNDVIRRQVTSQCSELTLSQDLKKLKKQPSQLTEEPKPISYGPDYLQKIQGYLETIESDEIKQYGEELLTKTQYEMGIQKLIIKFFNANEVYNGIPVSLKRLADYLNRQRENNDLCLHKRGNPDRNSDSMRPLDEPVHLQRIQSHL
jgi:hypothetical protein